jgi:hypothetical protein
LSKEDREISVLVQNLSLNYGAKQRERNIGIIKGLISKGKTREQIVDLLINCFAYKRINEYYYIALAQLKTENKKST